MVENDRQTGRIEEGTCCPGCEMAIRGEGIECFCEVEGYSSEHETWRWCTNVCYISTHEIAYPEAPPHPDE